MNYFKELQFYNTCMEKPKVKCLKRIDLLPETLIYFIDLNIDLNIELNIDFLLQAFKE